MPEFFYTKTTSSAYTVFAESYLLHSNLMSPPLTLAQTQTRLQTQGLDRLDAQLLLLHMLGLPLQQRGWLLAHATDPLPPELTDALTQLVKRRLAGEPVAYLVGHKEFFGLDLQVDARVLVPRPDTETLVNWALEVLDNRPPVSATSPHPLAESRGAGWPLALLDLGTGSGAIALALKSARPDLQVQATDISPDALQVALANARHLQLDIALHQGAWFTALTSTAPRFDCIVSNPPYIAALDPHLAALTHEPLPALTSGKDGLDAIRHIIASAPPHLKPGGWLLLEHGYDQAQTVHHLLRQSGFTQIQSRHDLAGIERCSGGLWEKSGAGGVSFAQFQI